MSGDASTPGSAAGAFILPILAEGQEIGGKARSLAHLAALGLPIPPAFVVGRALWLALRASGPPLPERLGSVADLAALDAARDGLFRAPFPAVFEAELQRALDAVERTFARPANRGPITFAVRSSGDTEDRSGSLGAGIYASLLRISRAAVPAAVRQVLSSFLTPAAWAYRTRNDVRGVPGALPAGGAVLIHPFVEGDAAGTAALDSSPSPPPPSSLPLSPSGLLLFPSHPGGCAVHIESTGAPPTATARAAIEAATRTAAHMHGPIEIEWVATKDTATFLQLRAYHAAPSKASPETRGDGTHTNPFLVVMDPALPEGPWTWDAAHNPLPLSPAQAGLVEMVDARCQTGVRQQLIGGYLFFRATTGATTGAFTASTASLSNPDVVSVRAVFDGLRVEVEPQLDALGPEPSLPVASELFVSAYGPLFGIIGPACVTARRALADFLASRFPDRVRDLSHLLAGVGSVAQSRQAAADVIASATTTSDRQMAIDAYLRKFGDESPRWDIAEPTLGENPERVVAWTVRQYPRQIPPQSRNPDVDSGAVRAVRVARELRDKLPASHQAYFEGLVAAARVAIAVGEDDDALFARLQAAMRRAVLAVGRRLVNAGRLNDVDDVFYLPLSVARAVDDHDHDVPGADASRAVADSIPAQDLRLVAAAGRRAFAIAVAAPPPIRADWGAKNAGILRGFGGAGGRIVGRVVHHPSSVPLGPESVLIAATLLPTELPLLSPAAIVVETGQALGHVAAQARERGIPAVVGAAGAISALPEGALIVVDGDRGEVVLLGDT